MEVCCTLLSANAATDSYSMRSRCESRQSHSHLWQSGPASRWDITRLFPDRCCARETICRRRRQRGGPGDRRRSGTDSRCRTPRSGLRCGHGATIFRICKWRGWEHWSEYWIVSGFCFRLWFCNHLPRFYWCVRFSIVFIYMQANVEFLCFISHLSKGYANAIKCSHASMSGVLNFNRVRSVYTMFHWILHVWLRLACCAIFRIHMNSSSRCVQC